tara:strand:+ start:1696 stop:2361 length:666 start_codon:yes stop_codon:yes gene_type:complete
LNWFVQNSSLISNIGVLFAAVGAILVGIGSHFAGKELHLLVAKNAELSEEYASYVVGRNSYLAISPRLNIGSPVAEIRHFGNYPVRNIILEVFDVSDQIPEIASGAKPDIESYRGKRIFVREGFYSLPQGGRVLSNFPFPDQTDSELHTFEISIYCESGEFLETLQLEFIDNNWEFSWVLHRVDPSRLKGELLSQLHSSGFPSDAPGRLSNNGKFNIAKPP